MHLMQSLPEKDYRAAAGLSSSEIKAYALAPTPLHFFLRKEKASKSLSFGTLAHTLCFEPHRFTEYTVFDGRRNKLTPAKAVKPEELAKARAIAKSVQEHPLLQDYLAEGFAEESAFWQDQESVPCKARFDFRNPTHKVVLDLKTSQTADPVSRFGFKKFASNYRYDLQAVHYLEAVKACTGDDYRFIFIVAESEHPHTVSLCELDEETLTSARAELRSIKNEIIRRRAQSFWEAWPNEIHSINLAKGF
jgi:hypothetical protein